MIIFGTRGITTTPDRGQFECPQCGCTQPYNLKRVRRFFTLYFIPVIPMDKLGEYVECPGCQGTFDVRILSYDPNARAQQFEALFFTAVKQIMIGVLLADGHIDDQEVRELQDRYEEITGVEIPEDELREEIAAIADSGASTTELAAKLSSGLNDKGREMTLRAAYAIAAADGVIDPSEEQMLHEIGDALGLSSAHFNGIIQEAAAHATGTAAP